MADRLPPAELGCVLAAGNVPTPAVSRIICRERHVDDPEEGMAAPAFDFKARWGRAVRLMGEHGIDALFLMKPANLAYFTGDGRPCALGLFTTSLDCVVSVPTCDYRDVRAMSAATDIRQFKNEEGMFHGFRDVIRDLAGC
jgi:hypothetical protein